VSRMARTIYSGIHEAARRRAGARRGPRRPKTVTRFGLSILSPAAQDSVRLRRRASYTRARPLGIRRQDSSNGHQVFDPNVCGINDAPAGAGWSCPDAIGVVVMSALGVLAFHRDFGGVVDDCRPCGGPRRRSVVR
jgi:hypothetical protein